MLTLAMDTTSSAASLAVLEDDRVIATTSTDTREFHSATLFRELEVLLGELSLTLDRFELYAVANGPGSFTGVRIGLSAAKAWAEAFTRPVAAISTLEAQAAQAPSSCSRIASVLDARRGQVYRGYYQREKGSFDSPLALMGPEAVMEQPEFREELWNHSLQGELSIATSAPTVVSDILSQGEPPAPTPRSILIHTVPAILAPSVGRLGYLRARQGRLADSLSADANYLRRTDAELHLKGSPPI